MAVQSGQRTTGNVASSQRVIDMHKEILLLEPDAAPFTVLTKQLQGGGRRRRTQDPKFSWHNDELEDRWDAVNDATPPDATGTTLTVDTGTLFAAEDLVKVPRTGEVFSVTSISTNDLTIVRGVGGTTAADFVDNDPLLIIGTAAEEGDTSQAARSENPTKVDNYTQIFKTSVEASGSWISSANESSPHDWRHQQKKAGIEHKKDIEEAFLYGAPGTATGADGKPRRFTGGLLSFATQNNQDAGGATTEAEIETFLRNGFRYGSQKKVLFASPLLLSVLNGFAQSKIQTVSRDKSYGISLLEWVSGHGTVGIVKHNLLEGAVYGGYGILVDFDRGALAYRYLHGEGAPGGPRDTKLYENRQAPDRDGRLDEWITECGLQAGLPKTHSVLTGVTS